jgi:hypothetical protein
LSKSAFALNLTPPQIDLLIWSWPAAYADKVKFDLQATDDLRKPFASLLGAPQNLGAGRFQMILPNPGSSARFYRLQLSLR